LRSPLGLKGKTMKTLNIRATKRVEYAIPVEVEDDIAARAEDGDDEAWKVIEKKVEQNFSPDKHYLDDDPFDPTDFEIMD